VTVLAVGTPASQTLARATIAFDLRVSGASGLLLMLTGV